MVPNGTVEHQDALQRALRAERFAGRGGHGSSDQAAFWAPLGADTEQWLMANTRSARFMV